MIVDVGMMEKALETARPFDGQGEMARKIEGLWDTVEAARDAGITVVDRKSLALVISGDDPAATAALAEAYARALHACGLVPRQSDRETPVMHKVDWAEAIAPGPSMDEFQTRDNAEQKIQSAHGVARGGSLIIDGIYNDPDSTVGPDFAIMAEEGGLKAIITAMNDKAQEQVPVIILTGRADRMAAFFENHPEMNKLFGGRQVAAVPAPPLPPPVMATALDAPLRVKTPLRLKPLKP